MKKNLLLLKDSLKPEKIEFINTQFQFQKMFNKYNNS